MLKRLFYPLLLLLPSVVMAQDFIYKDNISWGMKQSQVASFEKTAFHRTGYAYIIDTGINRDGLKTTVGYFFTLNDKLAQITEIFDNYDYRQPASNNANTANYTRILNDIADRYGPPLRESALWLDLSAKTAFHNNELAAIPKSEAEVVSVWDLPDTSIMLTMKPENQSRVRIIAIYQSKKHIDIYFTEEAERH